LGGSQLCESLIDELTAAKAAEIRERLARDDDRESVTVIGGVHPSTIWLPAGDVV
jgi:hypothetical protein